MQSLNIMQSLHYLVLLCIRRMDLQQLEGDKNIPDCDLMSGM